MHEMLKSERCAVCDGRGILCNEHPHDSSFSGFLNCERCKGTGLTSRELTLEERVHRLENLFDMILKPLTQKK